MKRQCFKIKHTQGGMRKYSYVRNDVLNTIYERDVIVTTTFDLYALPSSFPGFAEAQTITSHLQKLIPGYNKVAYGISLIEYTGIETILQKCPHFRDWIEKLKTAIA